MKPPRPDSPSWHSPDGTCADSYVPMYVFGERRGNDIEGSREGRGKKVRRGGRVGQKGWVGYVLSACIAVYSSYCITGLALLPRSSCTMRSHPIVHIQYPSTPWLHFAVRTFPERVTAIPLTFCVPTGRSGRFSRRNRETTVTFRGRFGK